MKAITVKPDDFTKMFACSCEHPVPVKCADGSLFYAPCGRCSSCLSSKYARQSFRGHIGYLDCSQMWFITLTYADSDLPFLSYVDNGSGDFIFTDDCRRSDKFGESFAVVMSRSEYDSFIEFKRRQKSTWNTPYLAYPLKSDIQLFNKLLRYYLSIYGIKCKILYRSEYGGAKKRPHWHLCLFFSSGQLDYSQLRQIVSDSWRRGINSVSLCSDSKSASYVSSYCSTSVSDSPDALLPLYYRTTIRCSNALGKPSFYKSLYDFFTTSSAPEFPCFQILGTPVPTSSYPRYIQNSFLPKCYGFSYLPDEVKITLYTLYPRLLGKYGFTSVKDLCVLFRSDLLNLHDNDIDGWRSFISLIFPEIAYYHRKPFYVRDDGSICNYDLLLPFFDDDSPLDKRLYSLLSLSHCIYVHSNRFGVSCTEYARRIMFYYDYINDRNLDKQRYYYERCSPLEASLIHSQGYDNVSHPYSQKMYSYYRSCAARSKHSKYLTDIYLFDD